MPIRKDIYLNVKEHLKAIKTVELIDLYRGQFGGGIPEVYGNIYTACLIDISSIEWETMTGQKQEGNLSISIYLYVKDGFAHQFQGSSDHNNGFNEIDLIETIVNTLQFIKTDGFKPLELSREDSLGSPIKGLMSYKLEFNTRCYHILPQKFVY